MDIKTLLLVLALGNASLCAALLAATPLRMPSGAAAGSITASSSDTSADGGTSRLWLLAKLLQSGAWLLLYLRGIIPDVFSILLGNAVLFAGVACDAAALWQLAGRTAWRRWLAPLLALAIAAFLACYLFSAGAHWRGAAGALIVSGFFALGALTLVGEHHAAGTRRLRRFLLLAMLLATALLLLRSVLGVSLPDGAAWLPPTWLQQLGFLAVYLMMLTNGYGYLLLSRAALQDELLQLAIVDTVTGVPNRRGFYDLLAPWLALARRPGPSTALIVLNIDHFKRINDGYGYPVGDALLTNLVDICLAQLRDSDCMGRLGGAEFAIQLPRTEIGDALMVAERIRAAIAHAPFKSERAMIALTASLGVTLLRAEDSMVSLFARADAALQAAKLAGRNRVAEAPADPLLDGAALDE